MFHSFYIAPDYQREYVCEEPEVDQLFSVKRQALYDVRLAEHEAGTDIKSLPTKPAKSKTAHPRPV